MIKGYLRIAVLSELLKGEKTGYALMKGIEAEQGKKPSAGSMYPLLKQLDYEEMISNTKDGRKIIYKITAKGKRSISKLFNEKKEFVQKHIEVCKAMNQVTGVKNKEDDFISIADQNVLRHIDQFNEFKNNIARILGSKKYNQIEPKLRKELTEMNKRLKKIR